MPSTERTHQQPKLCAHEEHKDDESSLDILETLEDDDESSFHILSRQANAKTAKMKSRSMNPNDKPKSKYM
jgi:hypothetical protein